MPQRTGKYIGDSSIFSVCAALLFSHDASAARHAVIVGIDEYVPAGVTARRTTTTMCSVRTRRTYCAISHTPFSLTPRSRPASVGTITSSEGTSAPRAPDCL